MTTQEKTPPSDDAVKIGLWGPPQSGKTTYLAALPIAARDSAARNGSWSVYPRSETSLALMEQFGRTLIDDHRFPEATVGVSESLEWLFEGDLSGSRFDRRLLRWLPRRGALNSSFVLDLIDVQGSAYHHDDTPKEITSAALDHLFESQGIIFFFDPIGEKDNRNSITYVRDTANQLRMRAARNGGRPGIRLHHQVSVCITKFDHRELFEQAQAMNLVTMADGIPRVRDEDAKQFFEELCSGSFWNNRPDGGQESAEYVRDEIKQLFEPENIHYFVMSSIGFSMEPPIDGEPSAWFKPDAHSNYNERDERPGIKGKVRPINVLEPLIDLQQRIARR